MRKKLLSYIIRETKKRKIFDFYVEPTLEECYVLKKNGINVIKSRTFLVNTLCDEVEIIDTFIYFFD